jgi:hypothetical protein
MTPLTARHRRIAISLLIGRIGSSSLAILPS